MKCWNIKGKDCDIALTRRPAYCDRGNFLAVIDARGDLARDLDAADGWPRYYFDFESARTEVIAWLSRRDQFMPAVSVWTEEMVAGPPPAASSVAAV